MDATIATVLTQLGELSGSMRGLHEKIDTRGKLDEARWAESRADIASIKLEQHKGDMDRAEMKRSIASLEELREPVKELTGMRTQIHTMLSVVGIMFAGVVAYITGGWHSLVTALSHWLGANQ